MHFYGTRTSWHLAWWKILRGLPPHWGEVECRAYAGYRAAGFAPWEARRRVEAEIPANRLLEAMYGLMGLPGEWDGTAGCRWR